MSKYLKYPVSIILCAALVGCFQSDYTKLVKAELAKNTREDSLLLGIRFGDTRDDFYGKCFDLNKQKLVTQGPGNTSVQYIFTDSAIHKEPTEMRLLFYPTFDQNDVIAEMNCEISYTGWAPWNQKFQSDSLKGKAMEMLIHWYKGNGFVTAEINEDKLPVKLDGNRRLLVFTKDTRSVVVKIQDILHPYFRHSVSAD